MNQAKARSLSVDEIVALYVENGQAQYDAIENEQTSRFNRLFKQMLALESELKSRGRDQRTALLPLLGRGNLQVRLNAAKATLTVAPAAARRELEAIRETGRHPQGPDAAGCLRSLNEGVFKPT